MKKIEEREGVKGKGREEEIESRERTKKTIFSQNKR